MGLLTRWTGQRADPGEVRRELEAAFAAGGLDRLEPVCRKHRDLIENTFADWWADRPPIDDQIALNRHVQLFGTVAMLFDSRLGRPELLASIVGPPDRNPIQQWQAALARGSELLASGDEEGAANIGRTVLQDIDAALVSHNLEDERALAHYLIGTAAFQSGHVPAAREPLEASLAAYQGGDASPRLEYILGLFEVYRYLGDAQAAAVKADLLAGMLRGDAGAFFRRQGSILRAGEPLLRVTARVGDFVYEIDDVPAVIRASPHGVRAAIEYRRNRPSVARSLRAAQRGMALAATGEAAAALAAFDEAADVDPFDPHPTYQTGVLLMDCGRWGHAKAAFETTDALAPGWFYTRRYAWLADQVAQGKVRASTAQVAIRADEPGDPAGRLRLLDRALADDPELGLLHLYAGQAEAERGGSKEATNHYRRGLEGRHEPDVRAALQLALAVALQGSTEALGLLEQAVRVDGIPYTAGQARLILAMAPS